MQAERADHARLFGDRDELGWRDRWPAGRPPRERLERVDPSGDEIDDRLVMHLQQRLLHRLAQLVLAEQAIDDATVHAFVEHRVAAAAAPLGVVHGDVRVAEQLGGGYLAGTESNSDAGGHEQLVPGDRERHRQELLQALGDASGPLLIDGRVEQQRELVAADPCDRVPGS